MGNTLCRKVLGKIGGWFCQSEIEVPVSQVERSSRHLGMSVEFTQKTGLVFSSKLGSY
jgi:hypothetical protein